MAPVGGGSRNRVVPAGTRPLAVVGVTASGKSSLAMELARRRGDVELVSVDSMQVYRGMDIGTAKATPDERAEVPHHLLDLVDPWETFDLHTFQGAVGDALSDIAARGRRAVLVGGTALYLLSVVDGLELPGRYPEVREQLESDADRDGAESLHRRLLEVDPLAAGRMEPNNRRRVVRALEVCLGSGRAFSSFGPGLARFRPSPVRLVGLRVPRELTAERIERRYHQQMADGFLEEVRRLHDGPTLSHTAAQALGYRELLAHLDAASNGLAATTEAQAVEEASTHTRTFARRQEAWFRRDPRIGWLDGSAGTDGVIDTVQRIADSLWGPAPA